VGKIIKNKIPYTSDANTISLELTQAEYDALPQAEKNNGTVYHITDAVPIKSQSAVCGYTPIGTIISVMGNNPPRNYLACNGQIVNILTYPELANYFEEQFGSKNYFGGNGTTTFGIPDLRGEFLRGTGTNSHTNQGSGANVGVHQDATSQLCTYTSYANSRVQRYTPNITDYPSDWSNADNQYYAGTPGGYKLDWNGTQSTYPTAGSNSYTSRPTNTSVLYCIAVRNIYVDARYDYSTDEKVIGTWIDGKPLYQKTFEETFTESITDGTVTRHGINLNTLSIEFLRNVEGVIETDSTNHYFNPMVEGYKPSSTMYSMRWYTGNNNGNYTLFLETNRSTISGMKYYITIQYTKTTD